MRIEALKPNLLSAEQIATWSALQQADPCLANPFFRPEFTLAVAAVRDDVEVAVLHEQGGPVGFFPYQRQTGDLGVPVGGRMSDYQALIGRAGLEFSPEDLLDQCHLRALNFDHLLAGQLAFQPFHRRQAVSPYMDLSPGFDRFHAACKQAHKERVRRTERRTRKLERELGPIQLQYGVQDAQLLEKLCDWKIRQFHDTGVANVFAVDWTRALLEKVLEHQSSDFSGVLNALYAGERLLALQLGMAAGATYHCWFSAYDPELGETGNYSPGLVMLVEFARAAYERGIRLIDLGKGPEPYKLDFTSGGIPLAQGFVDRRMIHRAAKNSYWRVRNWVRSSPLRRPVKAVANMMAPAWSTRLFR